MTGSGAAGFGSGAAALRMAGPTTRSACSRYMLGTPSSALVRAITPIPSSTMNEIWVW